MNLVLLPFVTLFKDCRHFFISEKKNCLSLEEVEEVHTRTGRSNTWLFRFFYVSMHLLVTLIGFTFTELPLFA